MREFTDPLKRTKGRSHQVLNGTRQVPYDVITGRNGQGSVGQLGPAEGYGSYSAAAAQQQLARQQDSATSSSDDDDDDDDGDAPSDESFPSESAVHDTSTENIKRWLTVAMQH